MLIHLGNTPAQSHPKGIEFAKRLVPTVPKHCTIPKRASPTRQFVVKLLSRIRLQMSQAFHAVTCVRQLSCDANDGICTHPVDLFAGCARDDTEDKDNKLASHHGYQLRPKSDSGLCRQKVYDDKPSTSIKNSLGRHIEQCQVG
jgi:hypothetical protein